MVPAGAFGAESIVREREDPLGMALRRVGHRAPRQSRVCVGTEFVVGVLLALVLAIVIVPVGIAALVVRVALRVIGWVLGACLSLVLVLFVLAQCVALV